MYAFRCNNCQTLAPSEAAGERDVPLKCSTCGKGAHYIINEASGAPEMVPEPENWTVLADLDDNGIADVLEYHGITTDDIDVHVPFVTKVVLDGDGHPVLDENQAIVHETAPREGPMVEPANPQHIVVHAVEEAGTADVVEANV